MFHLDSKFAAIILEILSARSMKGPKDRSPLLILATDPTVFQLN